MKVYVPSPVATDQFWISEGYNWLSSKHNLQMICFEDWISESVKIQINFLNMDIFKTVIPGDWQKFHPYGDQTGSFLAVAYYLL